MTVKVFSAEELALQSEIVRRLSAHQAGPKGIACDAHNLQCPDGHPHVVFDRASATGNDCGINYIARCSAKSCSWAMSWS